MEEARISFYPVFQPFTFLYKTGVQLRNLLFDRRLLPSEQYPIPVICVGNIAAGGTGKTPLVEYLIRMLSAEYRIAVLSRGYKRKSSGYVLADGQSTSAEIGDEACQIKWKYPQVIVAVDGNRRRGMRNLLAMPEEIRPQVVLLDDGYQHRYIQPSFSIVVTDYNRLFYKDKLLPTGRLREPVQSVARADMVLVGKCPEIIEQEEYRDILKQVSRWIREEDIHFSQISYQQPECVFPQACLPCKPENIQKDDDVLLITGIANPAPLIAEIRKYSDKVRVITFGDHHAFKKKDMQKIQLELTKMTSGYPLIFCTEKDAARIRNNPLFADEWKSRMYYIPIKTHFASNHSQTLFERRIIQHIKQYMQPCNEQK